MEFERNEIFWEYKRTLQNKQPGLRRGEHEEEKNNDGARVI